MQVKETAPATSRPRRALPWLVLAAAWIGALFAVGPFDLEISEAIADPERLFGVLVQDLGTAPNLAVYLIAIVWLLVPQLRRRNHLLSRAAAAILTQAVVHTLAVTDALKFLWGRIRYMDLAADHAGFTPFYLPHFGGEGLSFPSGHVATSLVALPVALLLLREGRRRAAVVLFAFSVCWGAAIAFGRILYGAHYLTDVLFSIGAAALFAPVSLAIGDRYLTLFDRKKPHG